MDGGTAIEWRHWSWLRLPPVLEWLNVRAESGVLYVQLFRPSHELAVHALLEAVLEHAAQFPNPQTAPRLIIEARPRPT